MIRVILSWLGWVLIAFGLLEIAYELFVNISVMAEVSGGSEQARSDGLLFLNKRLDKFGDGIINLALGAIMVGIYQLLIKADRQNVTPMKAKKDLGNWPPSV